MNILQLLGQSLSALNYWFWLAFFSARLFFSKSLLVEPSGNASRILTLIEFMRILQGGSFHQNFLSHYDITMCFNVMYCKLVTWTPFNRRLYNLYLKTFRTSYFSYVFQVRIFDESLFLTKGHSQKNTGIKLGSISSRR